MHKFINAWKENEYNMLPSFLAFYMLQSIIPSLSIILGFTRIFKVPDEVLLNIVHILLPNASNEAILSFLRNEYNQGFSLIINILSFHIIARAIKKLSYSINKLYNLPQLNFIYSYIKAYFFTLLLLISTAFGVFIIFLFSYYFKSIRTSIILYPILIIYLFVLFLLMFHFLPSIRLKYRNIYPGSLFVSISIALLLTFIPLLNNKFIRLDSIYGSISWIMILLFLLHIISYIVYLGIIINSTYINKVNKVHIHKKRSIL